MLGWTQRKRQDNPMLRIPKDKLSKEVIEALSRIWVIQTEERLHMFQEWKEYFSEDDPRYQCATRSLLEYSLK